MSDTTPIPPTSEEEAFELWSRTKPYGDGGEWDAWQARAALSHPSTPQGWKLVPVEPVLVMLQAGRDLDLEGPGNGWLTNLPHYELRDIWQAMLNAAPPPPEQGGKG